MTRDLELEIDNAARELAERYEEINLLYTISEILGRTVSLDEAASTILRELSETIGARRGSIFILDSNTGMLEPIAVIGVDRSLVPSISPNSTTGLIARAFRTRTPVVVSSDETRTIFATPIGALLAVPILWTTGPGQSENLGVVALADRINGDQFMAGDVKLLAAIASQIGSTIQNSKLVKQTLEQQRLLQEVQLAHDLQMKLLPSVKTVAPQAEVAARVVPAESVGGDFYHLFRLTPSATGVMIGDVSSHGYRAALIMALAMSAAAIHAQGTLDPNIMLNALTQSMREELLSTEMFMTMFYGVVDTSASSLSYANAGHPHAFLFSRDAAPRRLGAIDPPIGMNDNAPGAERVDWNAESDMLVLFTDGMTDALNAAGESMGEKRVLDVISRVREKKPEEVVESVFAALRAHIGDIPTRDDLTLVVLRS